MIWCEEQKRRETIVQFDAVQLVVRRFDTYLGVSIYTRSRSWIVPGIHNQHTLFNSQKPADI